MRRLLLACVFVITFTDGSNGTEPQIVDAKVTWETCGAVTTLFSKKEVCYEVGITSNDSQWTIKICGGVLVSGGTLLIGAETSSLMCATVIVKADSEEEARKAAEAHLKEKLSKKSTRKAAQQELDSSEIMRVQAFEVIIPDDETKARLWKEIENLDTNPFVEEEA